MCDSTHPGSLLLCLFWFCSLGTMTGELLQRDASGNDWIHVSETFKPSVQDGYALIESVKTTSGKQLLYPMNLLFPEGSVTAILGPSGAGKSTLMNLLTDSLPGNSNAFADIHLPGQAALVPQDDRLHGFFTVNSYMRHYARLSGLGLPSQEEEELIDLLVSTLGLKGQTDTIVGDMFLKGLSGGQKRRLSICLEALTCPATFFLDEPTTGLDAESALQVMEFLKSYARAASGRRVILTIHQPSSFVWKHVDNTILLAKGKLMYQGSRVNMEKFFVWSGHPTPKGWNPADHYLTVVNDEFRDHVKSVDEWAALYSSWEDTHHLGGSKSTAFKPSSLERSQSMLNVQFKSTIETKRSTNIQASIELTRRYFLSLCFNPGMLLPRIVVASFLALMIGAVFWGLGDRHDYESIMSRAAVLMYSVVFFIFMSIAILPFTMLERDIVDKEVLNCYYHPFSYHVAQGLASIPGTGVLALIVTAVIVPMVKLREPGWYLLNMFLALWTSEALAQLISHIMPHFVIGMALIAGIFGCFMLFQGFILVPSAFPNWLQWANLVPFHTYTWRSFMVSEFSGAEFPGTPYPTGEDVLLFYDIENVNRRNDMFILVLYTIVLHALSLVALRYRYSFFKGEINPASVDENAAHKKSELATLDIEE